MQQKRNDKNNHTTIGLIGLGKMGAALVFRLTNAGFKVIGFDPDLHARRHAATYGAHIVASVEHVAQQARVLWLMLPAGPLIDTVLHQMQPFLQPHDTIIDGGNSHFTDAVTRAQTLKRRSILLIAELPADFLEKRKVFV